LNIAWHSILELCAFQRLLGKRVGRQHTTATGRFNKSVKTGCKSHAIMCSRQVGASTLDMCPLTYSQQTCGSACQRKDPNAAPSFLLPVAEPFRLPFYPLAITPGTSYTFKRSLPGMRKIESGNKRKIQGGFLTIALLSMRCLNTFVDSLIPRTLAFLIPVFRQGFAYLT